MPRAGGRARIWRARGNAVGSPPTKGADSNIALADVGDAFNFVKLALDEAKAAADCRPPAHRDAAESA